MRPRDSRTEYGWLVMYTSQSWTNWRRISLPSSDLRSSVRLRLFRPSICQNQLLPASGVSGMLESDRNISPAPGRSILMTSAPKSASIMAAAGAAITVATSSTFNPEKRYVSILVPVSVFRSSTNVRAVLATGCPSLQKPNTPASVFVLNSRDLPN